MKFDFCIGNPPYQEATIGKNESYAPPVYNHFLESAYQLSKFTIMIHPARFLFDAGSTPKIWNKKMLEDEYFKVLDYEPASKKIFANTDIKGGIAITCRNSKVKYGKIGFFTSFKELNSILNKVKTKFKTNMCEIIYAAESYHFTEFMHKEHPDIEALLSKGHKYDLKSNVLDNLYNMIFFEKKFSNSVCIVGRKNNERANMYIDARYIVAPNNFNNYKVFLPNANGSGALGEVLSTPLVGEPLVGHTQTFLSIGNFNNKNLAINCMKYIKTKFCRAMLGILKVTQSNSRPVWKYVPLQDFTDKSDIDWSKSIHEIDLQLYKKYGLDKDEIEFIETHVREMA
ncbi:MAG: Eco57I restriction-modification methylase domain-containing protein [Alphaproteobacteria bacterium]|nr:Eco57I restriction-modification methylase domain-containing protein [Alphaproteobacteria bacterium]